jgi:exodeoxyribonuclease-3
MNASRERGGAQARIDHLLLNAPLAERLLDAGVDRWVRGLEKASDHAPAWITLAAEPSAASPRKPPSKTVKAAAGKTTGKDSAGKSATGKSATSKNAPRRKAVVKEK